MLGRMFVADETQSLDQMKHELISSTNPAPSTCSIASKYSTIRPSSKSR